MVLLWKLPGILLVPVVLSRLVHNLACDVLHSFGIPIVCCGVQVSLSSGSGARRLAEARCRAAIQLLLVQACGEVYASHAPRLPQAAAILMLDALAAVAEHARGIDADLDLRRDLAAAQAAGKVRPCGNLLALLAQ